VLRHPPERVWDALTDPDRQRRIYELRPEGLAELIGWLGPYQQLWRRHLDALEAQLDEQARADQR
jgi:hypothetical protein